MKKCISFVFIVLLMMSMTCSAGRVRLSNITLNDFVNYYNNAPVRAALESNFNLDLSMNARPFKDVSHSDANYVAYSFNVGSGSKFVYTVLYVDNNGYVSAIYLSSGASDGNKQLNLLAGVMIISMLACGMDQGAINQLMDECENAYGDTVNTKLWNANTNRYINMHYEQPAGKNGKGNKKIFLYATND